jgi:ubiquinone biosynthesis accessory factor UbiJ
MFHLPVPDFLAVAALERATLLANHVLSSEDVATQKLRGHAGRCIQLELHNVPPPLPVPPALVFEVTPAGLLEWQGPRIAEHVDLHVRVDASNPAGMLARLLAGERPRVEVQGDAGLATDLNWLIDNLRWDVEDDLARLVGAAPAHQIAALSRAFAAGLRTLLQRFDSTIDRAPARGAR